MKRYGKLMNWYLACIVLAGINCYGIQQLAGVGVLNNANNWSPDKSLTSADHYGINVTGGIVRTMDNFTLIGDSSKALLIASGADGTLTMTGGTFNVNGWVSIGHSNIGKHGALNLSGGTLTTVSDLKVSGAVSGSDGILDVSGGVLNIGRHFVIGSVVYTNETAVMNYTGGNVSALGQFQLLDGGELNFQLGCDPITADGARAGGGVINLLFDADYSHIVGVTNVLVSSVGVGGAAFNLNTDAGLVALGDATAVSVNGHKFEAVVTTNILGLVAAEESSPEPSQILSTSVPAGDIVQMVMNLPGDSNRYQLLSTTNLTDSNSWAVVPHSDNGTNPFVETNLSYSTSAGGTTNTVYIQAQDAVRFFGISYE